MIRPCPLCDHTGDAHPTFPFETVWNGRSFRYHRCSRCECVFVDPVPTDAEFGLMYATSSYHDVHYTDGGLERHRPSLEFLARHVPASGTRVLLDFGCGNGSFLRAAARAGFSVQGVEHSAETARDIASRTGLRVTTLTECLAGAERFDVIHLGDVLEHLPHPADRFDELRALLAPGGVFFVEGPLQANASLVYWGARAFRRVRRLRGEPPPGRSAPTHLLLATQSSQRRFFTERLRYEEVAFAMSEDGWPYLSKGPKTPGSVFRGAVGSAAVVAARLPGLRTLLGNRFMTVVRPR